MENLIAFAGFAMQWLRAQPWWNDAHTFGAVCVFAAASLWIFHPPGEPYSRVVAVDEFLKYFLMIQGGLSLAMQGSHGTGMIPKWKGGTK